jgi:hypothetical protein
MAGEPFSSPEQARYYFWFPLGMAGMSLVLIVLGGLKYAKVAVQCISVLMLMTLLPYLLFYTGGM